MALVIPTSLGQPTLPQPGQARRVAQLDNSGPASALIEGSRVQGEAWHRTAAGMQDLANAYDKLQLQVDQKEAKDWLNQLITAKTNLMYGDGTDANPGYMNLQGDAAVKGAKAAGEQLDKLRTDLLSKASNKQVAKLYDAASMELVAPDHEEILKHAGREHFVALDATDNATIAAATDQLSANPTDPKTLANSMSLIYGSVNSLLDRQGITDPTARAQKLIEAGSAAKAQAIQTALVRDPAAGAALYAKWKDSIQGTDQAKLEQFIVAAEDRQMRKQEHQVYMAEAAKSRASNEAAKQWAHAIVAHAADPDKNPDVSLEAIAVDGRLDAGDTITLYNMQKQADKGEADSAVSRRTLASIMPQLMAPYGTPGKFTDYKQINQLMSEGKLTRTDWSFAAGIIEQGKTEDGTKIQPYMSAALQAATRVIGKPDINGIFPDDRHAIMLQQWTEYMYNRVEQFKKENKDPQELFNPNNKDYVLAPGVLNQYKIPFDSTLEHRTEMFNQGVPEDQNVSPVTPPNTPMDAPVFANPNDPGFIDLPPGSKFYKLDPETNQLKAFYKGKKTKGQQSGSTPVLPPTVTAPTGQ